MVAPGATLVTGNSGRLAQGRQTLGPLQILPQQLRGLRVPGAFSVFLVKYRRCCGEGKKEGSLISVLSQSHSFSGVMAVPGAEPRTKSSAELDRILSPKP